MEQVDGVRFVDLGICVIVEVGDNKALGITRDQLVELIRAPAPRRARLLETWRAEAGA